MNLTCQHLQKLFLSSLGTTWPPINLVLKSNAVITFNGYLVISPMFFKFLDMADIEKLYLNSHSHGYINVKGSKTQRKMQYYLYSFYF